MIIEIQRLIIVVALLITVISLNNMIQVSQVMLTFMNIMFRHNELRLLIPPKGDKGVFNSFALLLAHSSPTYRYRRIPA